MERGDGSGSLGRLLHVRHNNHHAYPESSRLGLKAGEWDIGWWVLRIFERLGLAWGLRGPETLPARLERRDLETTVTTP